MAYDVVVVGGGIGGLTVAALLSARGLSVCLFERQSQVGGCISRIEFSGYDFEPGMGLYTGWDQGEIYEQVFSELPVQTPRARLVEDDYVVRLAGDIDIRFKKDHGQFSEQLTTAFPECAKEAVEFYNLVQRINEESVQENTNLLGKTLQRIWPTRSNSKLEEIQAGNALSFATKTSVRFQRFIDAQLKAFLQTGIERCAFVHACHVLALPRSNRYAIENGIATLAERLADSIKQSGGAIRLNSPVLRLSYDDTGQARGVDLLSGETIIAKRAIISNLTIWDTYGKLVGLNRTPAAVKSQLSRIQGSGAYLIYAALDDSALTRLPSPNFIVAQNEPHGDENLSSEFTLSIGEPAADGKRPMTIKTGTDVGPWFSFQTSEEDYEQWDQTALAKLWENLHQGVPELGASVEVIESANPRTFYELTRRKLGMVMGVEATSATDTPMFDTSLPNLFIISDTVSNSFGVPSVVRSGLHLAKHLTR